MHMNTNSGWRKDDGEPGANGCWGGSDDKPCNGFALPGTTRCYFTRIR
jgi:hypothetical protein